MKDCFANLLVNMTDSEKMQQPLVSDAVMI